MNNQIKEIRKIRSDLHSEWKIGEFDQAITDRVYLLLLSRLRITLKNTSHKDVYEWLEDAKVQRDIYGNWVRYRDK